METTGYNVRFKERDRVRFIADGFMCDGLMKTGVITNLYLASGVEDYQVLTDYGEYYNCWLPKLRLVHKEEK